MIGWRALAAAAALAAAPLAPVAAQAPGRSPARLEQMLQQRLGLSQTQLQRLQSTNQELAPRRRELARRERALADSLQGAIAGTSRDEAAVSGMITRLFAVRRARLELREREQQAWAAYLSPTQRAMLLGFQERAWRRGEALQGARRGRANREPARPPGR